MKSLIVMGLGLSMMAMSSVASAIEANSLYIGGMMSNSKVDIDASYTTLTDLGNVATYSADDSEAAAYTFHVGYNIYNWLAVEAQAVMFEPDEVLGNNLEISTSAAGLYAVFGAGGDAYAQFLFGVGSTAADFSAEKSGVDYSPSGTSYSYGVRLGAAIGPGAFEIMYMRYPDIQFSKNDFASATSVGNVDSGGDNLGGIRLGRRLATEVISIGYRYTFNF